MSKKLKSHSVRKARNGSAKKRKRKQTQRLHSNDFFSKKVRPSNTFNLKSFEESDLTKKSRMIICAIFQYSADKVFNYLDTRVRIDSQNQPATGFRFNYPDLDTSIFLNESCYKEEFCKSAMMYYYNASMLDAAPDSSLKILMYKAIERGIHDLYYDLIPKESEKEIYDYLDDALRTLFTTNYTLVKSFIESAVEKSNYNMVMTFNQNERYTLESYTNFDHSFEIQVYCFNMYKNYLIYTKLSNNILDHGFRIGFGFEWEKFKEELQSEINHASQY
ncbi:hypothetical protein FJZ55_02270 [Candidatus Woesearchaeota archaeon]|nr:hypothetical protein [Candidatus Woesearchaeota archaeon]